MRAASGVEGGGVEGGEWVSRQRRGAGGERRQVGLIGKVCVCARARACVAVGGEQHGVAFEREERVTFEREERVAFEREERVAFEREQQRGERPKRARGGGGGGGTGTVVDGVRVTQASPAAMATITIRGPR